MLAPSIFWTTVPSLFLIMGIATVIGRPFSLFFPKVLRSRARFYLAPGSRLGCYPPVRCGCGGDIFRSVIPIIFPFASVMAIVAVLLVEPKPHQALAHSRIGRLLRCLY